MSDVTLIWSTDNIMTSLKIGIGIGQWNEYNWNAISGGKFEAFRSQSFHAKLNTAKTTFLMLF